MDLLSLHHQRALVRPWFSLAASMAGRNKLPTLIVFARTEKIYSHSPRLYVFVKFLSLPQDRRALGIAPSPFPLVPLVMITPNIPTAG